MSIYYPASNCGGGAIPAYTCNPCPDYSYGRVRSIAYVRNSYSFTDPSDPTEWNSALAAGDAIIIWSVSGNYDGGSVQELPGFGDSEFVTGGISHVLVYRDPSVIDNCDFYNAIKDSTDYTVWFRTSSHIWGAGTPVNISVKMPVADDLKSVMTYEVTLKWQNPSLPCPSSIPDGIFETCFINQ